MKNRRDFHLTIRHFNTLSFDRWKRITQHHERTNECVTTPDEMRLLWRSTWWTGRAREMSSTPSTSTSTTTTNPRKKTLPKPVLSSPAQIEAEAELEISPNSKARLDQLIARHAFPEVYYFFFVWNLRFKKHITDIQDLEKSRKAVTKEENEKRVKALRKELDHIQSTNWMYEPVDKLTGQWRNVLLPLSASGLFRRNTYEFNGNLLPVASCPPQHIRHKSPS